MNENIILSYGYKLFKLIFLPYYISQSIFTEFKSFIEFYIDYLTKRTQDNLNVVLYPFYSLKELIYELIYYFMGRFFLYSKGFLKLILFSTIFLFNSIVITLICYSFVSLPTTVDKNLTFSYYKENILYTKLLSNCPFDNCINDLNNFSNYKIYVELYILRNENSVHEGNFETELQFFNEKKEGKSVKKVSFLDRNDDFTEKIKNIVLLPLKVLGAFKQEIIVIKFYKSFYFSEFNLKKVYIFLKNSHLLVKKGRIIFEPINSWIKLSLYYTKIVSIPIIFGCTFMFQVILYIINKIFKKLRNLDDSFTDD